MSNDYGMVIASGLMFCGIWFIMCCMFVMIAYICEWIMAIFRPHIAVMRQYVLAKISQLLMATYVFINEKLRQLRKPSKKGHELVYRAILDGASWNSCTKAALEWTKKNETEWSDNTCDFAAIYGYLDILQTAKINGCEWSANTCALAAKYGHLELLKWAKLNGCEWDSKVCSCAASNGHLHVLKWARENKCDWDFRTCAVAAINDHREVLLWARMNGAMCDDITKNLAMQKWPKDFI